MTDQTDADGATTRRTRDRKGTEQRMLNAARTLLERNGILAGLNLREVADEAGVNRGLMYQYFGSRRGLLRAAIAEHGWEDAPIFQQYRSMPFATRRELVLEETIRAQDALRLTTLLVLDGDPDVHLLPQIERSRLDLERDQENGDLDPDVDAVAAHVMTAAMNFGYTIFREQFARETGRPVEELDEQVAVVLSRMLNGLAAEPD